MATRAVIRTRKVQSNVKATPSLFKGNDAATRSLRNAVRRGAGTRGSAKGSGINPVTGGVG